MMARRQTHETTEPGESFTMLRLKNVRCFDEVEIPLDPRMTIIIGENGAGKTTMAEAMASLSYGEDEGLHDFPLRRGQRVGHIALFETGRSRPLAIWRHGGRYPTRQRLPEDRYLFAYGRIGETNALFKPRADTDQPVMSAASRVPRARDKAQAQGAGDGSKRPFIIIINFISIGWLLRSALRWTNATRIEPTAASVSDDS